MSKQLASEVEPNKYKAKITISVHWFELRSEYKETLCISLPCTWSLQARQWMIHGLSPPQVERQGSPEIRGNSIHISLFYLTTKSRKQKVFHYKAKIQMQRLQLHFIFYEAPCIIMLHNTNLAKLLERQLIHRYNFTETPKWGVKTFLLEVDTCNWVKISP